MRAFYLTCQPSWLKPDIMSAIRSICVYCGSSAGVNPLYREAGEKLGRELAHADIGLVYGGGSKGIMGIIAQSVKKHGGHVTGIIPQFLIAKEAPEGGEPSLDELIITETMHQRKHLMFERSDAFVTMPGGIGTLEEIVEMMTWAQLGRHKKPLVFANIASFWNPLIVLLEHMKHEGFLHNTQKIQPAFIDTIEELLPVIFETAQKANNSDEANISRL